MFYILCTASLHTSYLDSAQNDTNPLTQRGHEIKEVLEARREGPLLVLLQAEVESGVDDQAELRDHL